MTIVVNQPGTYVTGASYIGWENLLLHPDAIVVGTHEEAAYPFENALTWSGYDKWKATGWFAYLQASFPTAVQMNCFGIYDHNIGTLGASVGMSYSTDSVTWTELPGTGRTPSDDSPIFSVGEAAYAKYWRFGFLGLPEPAMFSVGNIFLGNALRLYSPPESGFAPPNLAPNNQYITNRSDKGSYLGRSLIRRGGETGFKMTHVPESWVRQNWEPFLDEVESHPFYYSWDSVRYPLEAAYCDIDGRPDPVRYPNAKHMDINMRFMTL